MTMKEFIKKNVKKHGKKAWFHREAMNFFNTRLESDFISCPNDISRYLFITSDRDNLVGDRFFTVREAWTDTLTVSSFSDFQQFRTLADAKAFILNSFKEAS